MRAQSILPMFLLIALLGTTSLSFAQDEEHKVRRWTDLQTGQTVRAFLADIDGGVVTLQTRNGESFTIAHHRLSGTDQRYLRNHVEEAELTASLARNLAPVEGIPVNGQGGNVSDASSAPGYRAINWQPMETAVSEEGNDSGKPVFWFRVLGDLDGLM
ncbi:MAG: SHD1 domain-containing protein [Planctomycetota bacterium]